MGRGCSWPPSVGRSIERGIALAPEDRKREGSCSCVPPSRIFCLRILVPSRGDPSSRRARGGQPQRCWPGRSGSIPTGSTPTRSIFPAAISRSSSSVSGCIAGHASFCSTSRPGASTSAPSKRFSPLIRSLSDQGMGVILVSSDLEEVVEHADRILVMARGKQIATLDGHEG